jgi:hypothetical protein
LSPKIAILANSGIDAMITNPLTAPFKTSIEFIVFPTIGSAIKISGIYRSGI